MRRIDVLYTIENYKDEPKEIEIKSKEHYQKRIIPTQDGTNVKTQNYFDD